MTESKEKCETQRFVAHDSADDKGDSSIPRLDLTDAALENYVAQSQRRQSRRKLMSLWSYFTLRGFFHLIGRTVGAYPYAYLIVAVLLSLNSGGMYWMVLKDRIRDGYTPVNAPSRYETDVIREFWNSTGDPMMTILLLLAKDGGSMHRKELLDEASHVIEHMHNNFTAYHDGVPLVFREMCEPYCNMNKVFEMFKAGFDTEYALAMANKSLSPITNLSYPVATISNFNVHLERSLFGVRLVDPQKTKPEELTIEQRITNMANVEVILMLFRGDKGSALREAQFARWELDAYKWSLEEYNKSSPLDILVVGTEVLDAEMIRDGQRMTPFFAAGFGFMITFVTLCVYLSALYYGSLDRGKILVGIGATACPMLAIASTYGLISLLGYRVNSFMLVMPFLIMGIGVDAAFLMIHSWSRMCRFEYTIPQRMGMVYEEVGPSITITTLTDFLSFAIGALTPTPEIRLFCFGTAVAMGFTYIYQIILFGPVLSYASYFEHVKDIGDTARWRKKLDNLSSSVIKFYCRIIAHPMFTVLVLAGTLVYWYYGVVGLMNMQTKLDAVKILPRGSPLQKPNRILSNIVWAEYHPVTILINRPFDVANKTQTHRYWNMLHEFTSLHHAKDNSSSLNWLYDYIHYSYYGEPYDFMATFLGMKSEVVEPDIDPYQANLTSEKLLDFLKSPFYEHWKTFIRLKNDSNGNPVVDRFWINVAYQNTSTWETRIELMSDWRAIAKRYEDLNVTVWEPNGMFVDQMLSLKTVTMQTAVVTLLCMVVVCAIFIPNPCSVITASVSIASISLGVVGFMSWWNFDLDPVVMASILMTIGLSVDFIAHVAYHYQLTNRKVIESGRVIKIPVKGAQHKLRHTLEAIGWPMIQAGVSTICCILPLLFLASYSPSVFVASIFLVVSWGVLHGLVILPAFLSCLPECITNANCYRTFLSTSSEKSCRYVGSNSTTDEQMEVMEPIAPRE